MPDSPTPAAPAGSGWPNCGPSSLSLDDVLLAMRRLADEDSHTGHPGAVGATLIEAGCWIRQALARAEAAERERDEARELIVKERAGGDADREWLTTERDEARAALAASTKREAGLLRAINWAMGCGDADDFPISEPGKRYNWRPGLASRAGLVYDKEAGRYVASLAAPEGGTSRPTPPEGT